MKLTEFIFVIFCGIAAINALFLIVYFWIQRDKNFIPNILLSAFIIMGAFRIIKVLLLDIAKEFQFDVPNLIIAIPTITLVGPLLFFYVKSVTQKGFQFRWIDSLHTIPFIIIIITNLILARNIDVQQNGTANFTYEFLQKIFILLQLLIYIIFSFRYSIKLINDYKSWHMQKDLQYFYWLRNIVIAIFFLWLIVALYIIQTSIEINIYGGTIEILFYSFLIYVMLFFELRHKGLSTINNLISKIRLSNISPEDIIRYKALLINCMNEKELYKDHNLTLGKLAKELSMSTHLLSQIINEQFSYNFNDFINSYRIEEAKKMLADAKNIKLTVASLAYDCGFNTLSSFNISFKKFTGLTPSQFRNTII